MWNAGHRTGWREGRLRAWGIATLVAAMVVQFAGMSARSYAAPGRHHRLSPHGASGGHSARRHLPRFHPPAPEATWSRYMHTADPGRSRHLGCALGRRVRAHHENADSLVVLAFGSPAHRHGRWGASMFGRFANSRKIGAAAVAFGRGYGACLHGATGHLSLAIGTSNFGSGVTNRHGRVWASMVNRANRSIRSRGLADGVTVFGANDIEPGWRGPEATRHWINGYKSVTRTPYYNFGGAADCPPIGYCQGDWTIEDVWYAAWGSGIARPLPEIYSNTGSNAEQWYRLSLYSYKAHGRRMDIAGAMSQLQSCWDSHDRCRGISNTPDRSWSQLWRALNSDPRTAQPLPYSTNISWQN